MELIARIQALIRRCRVYDNADASDTTASSTIERCGLTLDTKCNNVSYDGRQLALTDKEYQILLLLISHPTKTFSTQNIFESVWNEPYTQFSNNTIMVHIKNLRNKLEAGCGCAHLIKTVWGKERDINLKNKFNGYKKGIHKQLIDFIFNSFIDFNCCIYSYTLREK